MGYFPAYKKRKKKRKSEPDLITQDILERLVRMRPKAQVRDCAGNERVFRSTIAEDQTAEEEE